MSTFDSVLIGAFFTCVVFLMGIAFDSRKKGKWRNFLISIVIVVAAMAALCGLAFHYQWESAILNISAAENAGTTPGNIQDSSHNPEEIIATAELKDTTQIDNCPSLIVSESVIYKGQTEYELMWDAFEDYTEYQVWVYEVNGDDAVQLFTEEIRGCTYQLDISNFEAGKSYLVNISVDNAHFSIPIIIEMASSLE